MPLWFGPKIQKLSRQTLSTPIEVAAALIARPSSHVHSDPTHADPEYLLSQRLPGRHLAGCWEFPGGKREGDEPLLTTLARELDEELGLRVIHAEPLLSLTHHYPEQSVRLWLFAAECSGTPTSCEGQAICWVSKSSMQGLSMPAADWPIVKMLSLKPFYAISPLWQSDSQFLNHWTAMCQSGQALLQWRPGQGLAGPRLRALAHRCAEIARDHKACWLLNGCPDLAREVGADGVHLNAVRLRALTARPEGLEWVAASCHDVEALHWAGALGVDFVTLSPVQATASHPEARPLGWDGLAALVAQAPVPVMALGGLSPQDLVMARQQGAYGVAGIRAFASVNES